MDNKNQNGQESKSNNGYQDLKLSELKELAKSRGLSPEGNQGQKNTYISALEASDSQKSANRLVKQDPFASNETISEQRLDGFNEALEAQETIFDSVLNKLEQRGVSLDSLSLKFDGQEALTYKNGDVNKNSLTESQSKLLQSALQDPQNFQGSVTIRSGNRTLLKIRNGQVTRDALGLTSKSMKLDIESGTKELYEKYSKETKGQGLAKTKEVIANATNDNLDSQRTKQFIKAEDAGYQQVKESGNEEMADKSLDKMINQASAQKKIRENQSSQTQEQNQTREKTPAQSR